METNTAKHFALQLGALIALYVSVGALIATLFSIITIVYPDPVNLWESEGAQGSMRFSIALLVVFFPTYAYLTRRVNVIRRTEGNSYLPLTKWLIYLSLLVGGVVILGDLVSVIYNFLNGDLTLRFTLKAITVLGVVGAAFLYYTYDARGYWLTHESESKQYGMVTAVIVLVAVVGGYMQIDSPGEVRAAQTDERQINDLRRIQTDIVNYFTVNGTLPESIDVAVKGEPVVAPEGRDAYTYTIVGPYTFALCATFAEGTSATDMSYPYYDTYQKGVPALMNPEDWGHEAGRSCFTRIINKGE